MERLTLLVVALLVITAPLFADENRYATATIITQPYATNIVNGSSTQHSWGATNTIQIADGETGELLCVEGTGAVSVVKDGLAFEARPASWLSAGQGFVTGIGTTVAGPASFVISRSHDYITSNGTSGPAQSALMTVKLMPKSVAADKTIIVPPGSGLAEVRLESSTNLIHWSEAVNGVYNATNGAYFFRIRVQR